MLLAARLMGFGDALPDLDKVQRHLPRSGDAYHPGVFLGVDPSLSSTGLCLLQGAEMVVALLRPPRGLAGPARLSWFLHRFRGLFDRPARAAGVEGYSFGSRASRGHALGELGGLVRLAAWEAGVDVAVVPPATLKLFAAGRGDASKGRVRAGLARDWGLHFEQDDLADAAALALAARRLHVAGPAAAAAGGPLAKAALVRGREAPLRVVGRRSIEL